MSTRADWAIRAAYDARAAEYLAVAGDLEQMDAADRSLIATWRDGTEGPLLDAGCGPGHWTAFLVDGHREARGIDLSVAFIDAARTRHPGIRFDRGTLQALPDADASLGGVLAWYSLIHTPPGELPGILAECARVLRPGGSILLGFFDGPAGEPFAHAVAPAWFWTADALGEMLTEAGFVISRRAVRGRGPDEISRRAHGDLTAVRTVDPPGPSVVTATAPPAGSLG